MTARPARRALLALLTAALAGCTVLSPPSAAQLSGRLSLRVEASAAAPARNFSADFDLQGDAQRGELHLTGPLGATLARLGWRPGGAWLAQADGRREYPTLDALSEDLLGETLPLAALIDWLRARPWPGAPNSATADGFEQLGWRVDTRGRAQGLVVASRERAPAVVVRARLETPS